MSGQAVDATSNSTTIALSGSATTAVKVDLIRLVSRISIAKISTSFDHAGLYDSCSFVPTAVFLYDAATSSNWAVGATAPTTTTFGHGEQTVPTGLYNFLGEAVSTATADYDATS